MFTLIIIAEILIEFLCYLFLFNLHMIFIEKICLLVLAVVKCVLYSCIVQKHVK